MKIISNQVHDQITGKLYKHLRNQIDDHVYIEARDRLSVQVYNEVRKQVNLSVKQHGLQYKEWVQIQEQINNQLKQNTLI